MRKSSGSAYGWTIVYISSTYDGLLSNAEQSLDFFLCAPHARYAKLVAFLAAHDRVKQSRVGLAQAQQSRVVNLSCQPR